MKPHDAASAKKLSRWRSLTNDTSLSFTTWAKKLAWTIW
jgi:hypothetical protein